MGQNQSQLRTRIRDDNIHKAVTLWIRDRDAATIKYGMIEDWDTSEVTDMAELFYRFGAFTFNEPIGGWDVSNVTNMDSMFRNAASFNQYIGCWDVSKVTSMHSMFCGATSFNQDISGWDVSSVKNMCKLFCDASSFNQDIGGWDVSSVRNMIFMFHCAMDFNQDISEWDVSNVLGMNNMFRLASYFNQNISGWDISNVTSTGILGMFQDSTALQLNLRRLNVDSFFGSAHRDMSPVDRKHFFAVIFPSWPRRKAYMMFLAGNGYLPCEGVLRIEYNNNNTYNYNYHVDADAHDDVFGDLHGRQSSTAIVAMTTEVPVPAPSPLCDLIFNVEDIARYICHFL